MTAKNKRGIEIQPFSFFLQNLKKRNSTQKLIILKRISMGRLIKAFCWQETGRGASKTIYLF